MSWTRVSVPAWVMLASGSLLGAGCSSDGSSSDEAAQSAGSPDSPGPNPAGQDCEGDLDLRTVTPVEPCAGDLTGHWVTERFDWPSMPIRFRYYLSDPINELDGTTTSMFRENYCFGEVSEFRRDLDVQFTIDDQGGIAVSAGPLDVRARHLDSCSIPVFVDETEMNDGSCSQFDQCTLDCGVCTCSYLNEGTYTYASINSEESKISWDLWGPADELSYCVEGDTMRLSSSRGLSLEMRRE